MAAIVTSNQNLGGVGDHHRHTTIPFLGETFVFDFDDTELDSMGPLTTAQKRLFLELAIRIKRADGLPVANFLGRVFCGDEATNVKTYMFCGPGAAITMTNMRNAGNNVYANVCPGLNGEWIPVDLTGVTEFYPLMRANFVGTGPWMVRIIRQNDSVVMYESPSLTQTGERELDPGWTALPQGFTGQTKLLVQMKSAVGADDPVIRTIGMQTR